MLQEDIYLLIAFLENGLEFNISVLATSSLNVKSPLWKIVFDRTGQVAKKMKNEHERFTEKPIKYAIDEDIAFEFSYFRKKFNTELKRYNLIIISYLTNERISLIRYLKIIRDVLYFKNYRNIIIYRYRV